MKPAPFEYRCPETLEEALSLLAEHGDEARPLAGGQSLVPAMSFRLARPAVLVDLNRIEELAFVESAEDGGLAIGAMTRQRTVERSAPVRERAPLLHETMPHIAHPQIRNRGTIGGSLAHADPAAELPAIALALDAELTLCSAGGERRVPAGEFYTSLFATALEPGELLTSIRLPAPAPNTGAAFEEVSRRHGDYALVGAAAVVTVDEESRIAAARLAYLSVGETPWLAREATAELAGLAVSGTEQTVRDRFDQVSASAAATADPPSDIHASSAFRRHLMRVLGGRVLHRATQQAAAMSTSGDTR
ncbi:MAG TPA: xanthine dehydrogenase family protein subunit M [Thermoanaerobaculia bacterium]|nr:xanthine dehydrogenase family protein subunit M [Thermoanaerobaculia bacterium]